MQSKENEWRRTGTLSSLVKARLSHSLSSRSRHVSGVVRIGNNTVWAGPLSRPEKAKVKSEDLQPVGSPCRGREKVVQVLQNQMKKI